MRVVKPLLLKGLPLRIMQFLKSLVATDPKEPAHTYIESQTQPSFLEGPMADS